MPRTPTEAVPLMPSRRKVSFSPVRGIGRLILVSTVILPALLTAQQKPLPEDPFSRAEPMSLGTNLWSVASLHADTAMASGDGARVRTTYDWGSTWIDNKNLDSAGTQLLGITMIDSLNAYSVGAAGVVMKTTNGGFSWSETITDSFQTLFGVSFTDSLAGTAVGDHGLILRTTDGGYSWSKSRKDSTKYPPLLAVSFTDANNGTAVGGSGTILRTSDGGLTWIQQTSGVTNFLYGVSCVSPTTATAVGTRGTILHTTDGGATWVKQTLVIDTAAHRTTDSIHYYYAVSFGNDSAGIAVGNGGRVILTTDAGTTWSVQKPSTANNLYGVTFLDTNRWIAVGGYGTTITRMDTGFIVTSAADKYALPLATHLDQNYPNPFNPQTTIPFTLSQRARVRLEICDILGRKVATLLSGPVEAGEHSVRWDATGFSTGVYYYRLEVRSGGNYAVETRKLLLLK